MAMPSMHGRDSLQSEDSARCGRLCFQKVALVICLMLHAFPEPGHSPARGGVYGCPHGPVVKDPPADAGATSSIPGQGTGTPQASRCPPQKKEKKQEFITIPNPWNRVRLCHCLPWRRRVEGYPLTLRPAHRRRPTTQLPPAPPLVLALRIHLSYCE